MGLKVVGAGIGRTGTHSLQLALQELLGEPCYHMLEVISNLEERVPQWMDAFDGNPDWDTIMKGYGAAVDWPAAAFWRELSEKYPDSVVLLSTRKTTDDWYKSANNTIFELLRRDLDTGNSPMPVRMLNEKFTPDWQNPDAAKAAYERLNAEVRSSVPPERLIDWQPGDGWEPICEKLGLPVPNSPFPHVNSTDDFRAMIGLEPLQ